MTTANGKKTSKTSKTPKAPKASKTAKAPVSRGRRKKIVAEAPGSAEIDKKKMAAFFSAAGLDKNSSEPVTEKVEVAVVEKPVLKESVPPSPAPAPSPAKATAASKIESVPVIKEPEPKSVVQTTESDKIVTSASDISNNLNKSSEEGETEMTTTEKTSAEGSGSGFYNILPMFVVLLCLALFWFYYISSTPLKQAAEVRLGQGQAEVSVLMSKVKGLEAEMAKMKIKLLSFEKAAIKRTPAREAKPVTAAVKKDSSFDKAPIPFWRNMKPRGYLIEQSAKRVKPEVKASAVKVDSFSKAPKPFWLTPRVNSVTSQKSVSSSTQGSSFDKAPKPFWLKD